VLRLQKGLIMKTTNDLAASLAALINRHTLADVPTDHLKAELARRGEALPQQTDLRQALAALYEAADMLNINLESGDYDDSLRKAMEPALQDAQLALVKDCADAVRRKS
jgi:hypothetical protein